METTLDRNDLKPEYANINCSQTQFEHFNRQAQWMISKLGKAKFIDYFPGDLTSYNMIYAPKAEAE